MSAQNEATYLDDFLKYEGEANRFSREKETLLSGENLKIGTVVGKITKSIPGIGTLESGTNGECTDVTGGAKTQLGTYKATCTTANAVDADGIWRIEAPDGTVLGDLNVTQGTSGTGTFTDPQINLTISYASGYNSIGDYFEIEVTEGSGKLVVLDFTAVDGSQKAHGILIDDYDASAGDKDCVAVVRDAVIAKSPLKWKITFTGGGTEVLAVGDTITSVTGGSGASARVVESHLTSGSWAGGDAAGYLIVDRLTGDFATENITFPGTAADSDDATVAATDIAGAFDDLKAAGIITREEA
jgi:hypothetical protein